MPNSTASSSRKPCRRPRGRRLFFRSDANGIVNVSAKDKATGKEQQIRIQASGGLSEAEIDRMVAEAEEHAEDDKRRREVIEARNQADALIYSTEKTLREAGDKVPADQKSTVETAIAELRSAMGQDDLAPIRSKTEALAAASMKLGEAMYQSQQAGPSAGGPGGDGSQGGGDEKVVDADFEEVEDDQKKSA